MIRVLVLQGGPDAEREVSLRSAKAISGALRATGRYQVEDRVIDRVTADELRSARADVIWPALHGRYGEGGPLQDVLEGAGTPYVGCRPAAARLAMDKVASKWAAMSVGLRCSSTAILDPGDPGLPMPLPVVVKPIFEGSTIGLHICRTEAEFRAAHAATVRTGKPAMIEPFVRARELTVGVIAEGSGLRPLPVIRITPADGLYDYEAKYNRNDTRYEVGAPIDPAVTRQVSEGTVSLARAMGIRHLCRADFLLDDDNRAWFLEVNTMPGFTDHSLVPMAAAAIGLDMPALCARLVEAALHDAAPR